MIGRLDVALFASVAGSKLGPRFVLSVLFPPFDLVVASLADVDVWQGSDFFGFLTAGIVFEGEFVLVGRGTALLFLLRVSKFVLGGHGCIIICSLYGCSGLLLFPYIVVLVV